MEKNISLGTTAAVEFNKETGAARKAAGGRFTNPTLVVNGTSVPMDTDVTVSYHYVGSVTKGKKPNHVDAMLIDSDITFTLPASRIVDLLSGTAHTRVPSDGLDGFSSVFKTDETGKVSADYTDLLTAKPRTGGGRKPAWTPFSSDDFCQCLKQALANVGKANIGSTDEPITIDYLKSLPVAGREKAFTGPGAKYAGAYAAALAAYAELDSAEKTEAGEFDI